MGNFFNLDSKFSVIMGRVGDLIILNILWIICCIPIVTIGASTTALYYVAMKMTKNEESYITKDFFKSFKQNFKQSMIIWLILLGLGIVLILDVYILRLANLSYEKYIIPVFFFLGLIYLFVLIYVFPILAKFDNTIKNTLINSLLFSIRYLPTTLLLTLITVGSMAIAFIFLQSFPFWIFIGGSLVAYAASFLYIRIFSKYYSEGENSLAQDKEEDN